jgi:aminoglycoside 6'-N-acetyltransferase
VLRPARPEDAGAVAALVAEPEVARWFGDYDEQLLDSAFVVEVGRAFAGWLGYAVQTDPQFPSVGLDIALAHGFRDRGLGRAALRAAVAHFAARGHHRFTIDPAADNARAIRCSRAVGFRPVGVLRAYERLPDGGVRDGLLMDLLAGEVT